MVKKGYRFVGEIDATNNKKTTHQAKTRRFWTTIIAIVTNILAILFYLLQMQKSIVPEAPEDVVPTTESVPAPEV